MTGLSVAELCAQANVDPDTYYDLIGGRTQPRLGTVRALCDSLGLGLADALEFDA